MGVTHKNVTHNRSYAKFNDFGALIGNIWTMLGVSIPVAIAGGVLAGGIAYGMMTAFGINAVKIESGHLSRVGAFAIPTVVGYLAATVPLGVVWRIYKVQRIWKFVAFSITVENLDAADHVVAKGDAASAIGEGLADGLDVAGF